MSTARCSVFFLFSLMVLLQGCQSNIPAAEDALQYIPADAFSVTGIHVGSLLEKAEFSAVKEMRFFKDAMSEMRATDPILAGFLEDPWSTGIDLEKPLYLVQRINQDNPTEVFMGLLASVADAAKVETMMNLIDGGEWEQGKGFIFQEQNREIIGWNDNLVVIGSSSGSMDLPEELQRIFNTDAEHGILTHSEIGTFIGGRHDIQAMVSLDAVPEIADAAMALSLSGISPNSLKGGHAFGHLDFGNGGIDGIATWSFDKDFSKHFAPFFKDKPRKDLARLLPEAGQVMQLTGALSPEGIHLFLSERPQYKSMANYSLKGAGLRLDDVLKALGGDMAFGLYGEDALLLTDLRDEAAFSTLLQAGQRLSILSRTGDGLYRLNGGDLADGEIFLLVKDQLVCIGNNLDLLQEVADGSTGQRDSGQSADALMSMTMDVIGLRWLLAGAGESSAAIDEFIRVFGGTTVDIRVNRNDLLLNAEMDNKSANILALMMQELEKAYQAENKATL